MASVFGNAFTELPLKKIGAGSLFMDEFERAKRKFQGTHVSDEVIELPLELNLSKDGPNAKSARAHYDDEDETVKITR